MPRRNRRDQRLPAQCAYAIPRFCGRCGTRRDLELNDGQRLCRSCVVLEARRRADRVPR